MSAAAGGKEYWSGELGPGTNWPVRTSSRPVRHSVFDSIGRSAFLESPSRWRKNCV